MENNLCAIIDELVAIDSQVELQLQNVLKRIARCCETYKELEDIIENIKRYVLWESEKYEAVLPLVDKLFALIAKEKGKMKLSNCLKE